MRPPVCLNFGAEGVIAATVLIVTAELPISSEGPGDDELAVPKRSDRVCGVAPVHEFRMKI